MKKFQFLFFPFLLLWGLVFLAQPTPAHAIPITFTDLNFKVMSGGSFFGSRSFDITNNTGQTWTDFHFLTTISGQGQSYFVAANPYTGPGSATLSTGPNGVQNSALDVSGLSIANGNIYSCAVNIVGGEFWAVGGQPTIDGGPGPPVPEPATMLLVGTGLAGIVGTRVRKKKKA